MTMRDQEEQDWKISVMATDLRLKEKQVIWETPRNIALLVTAVAAIAGLLGYRAGQNSSAPPPQIIFQPGSIVVPAAK